MIYCLIDSNIELSESDPRMITLEHNTKQAYKLFIPFCKFSDLRTGGKFLPTFRKWIADGKLKDHHKFILQTIQNTKIV